MSSRFLRITFTAGMCALAFLAAAGPARAGQTTDPFAAGTPTEAREGIVPLRYANLPPLLRSLEGAVAGRSGPLLIVGGGVDDRTVVFLEFQVATVLRLDEWNLARGLTGYAWSAAAQAPDSLIVVGGLVEGRPVPSVRRWIWRNRELVEEPLPDLPSPLWGAGALVMDNKLYVLGGFSSIPAGAPEGAVWEFDLSKAGSEAGAGAWRKTLDLPQGLGHPVAAAQAGILAVFGGLQTDAQSPTGYTWRSDLILHKPGSPSGPWTAGTPPPEPVAHAAVLPVGAQTISLAHGGRMDRPAPGAQAEPLESLLLYNVVTDTWYRESEPGQLAHAGAVYVSNNWWIIGNPPRARPPPAVEAQRARLEVPVKRFGWWDRGVLAFYFLSVVVIAIRTTTLTPVSEEYALGGRTLPGWAAGMGMFAAGAGGLAVLALPALAFAGNLSVWLPSLACIAAYFVQARWIYPVFRRLELSSVFEYLERRFNPHLRMVCAVQFLALQLGGLFALSLYLPARLLADTTGVSPLAVVIVAGLAVWVYAAQGGFRAVAWTGAMQGVLVLAAAAALLFAVAWALPGGLPEAIRENASRGKFSLLPPDISWALPVAAAGLLAMFLQQTFVQAGSQSVMQRVLGVRPGGERSAARIHNAALLLLFALGTASGLGIFAYFRKLPGEFYPSLPSDEYVVSYFLNVAAAPGTAGLVAAGALAGAMAVCASAINSSAVVIMEDCYRRFLPETRDEERLSVLRKAAWGGGALGLALALILAITEAEFVFRIWAAALGGLGGGIFGVFALGLFTRRANGAGAGAGAVAGALAVAALEFFAPGFIHRAWYLPIAMGACVGVGYFLSAVSGGPARELRGLTIYD